VLHPELAALDRELDGDRHRAGEGELREADVELALLRLDLDADLRKDALRALVPSG